MAMVVAASSFMTLPISTVFATNENFDTTTGKTVSVGDALAITDLQVAGDGDDEIDLTLNATSGSITFDTEESAVDGSGTSYVMLSGTRSEVNNTLATMQFSSDEIGQVTITAELGNNVGNVIWNDGEGGNGHAYIVINQTMTWTQAKAKAETYTFGGQQGYLATITDPIENDFVYEAIDEQTGWIGANDIASEGVWRWVTGPEAGTQFWSGNFSGTSVNDAYTNWDTGEPNNSDGDEDCGQFWEDGHWNDIGCNTTRPFVVEFGGNTPEELPQPVRTQFTIDVTAGVRNITTCEDLMVLAAHNVYDTITLMNDIDCADTDVAPMFEGDDFEGVFEGNGYTIRNFTYHTGSRWYIGLVNQAYNATFRNINIENFDITATGYVGALTSVANNTTITNVHVKNAELTTTNVSDNGRVGGLVGMIGAGTHIEDSSVEGGAINGNGLGSFGGLVGEASNSVVERSFSNTNINSTYEDVNGWIEIGGLIGDINAYRGSSDDPAEMMVRDAYSWTTINAPSAKNVGGLIGSASTYDETHTSTAQLTITRTYASGSVDGGDRVGGLIGTLHNDPSYDEGASYTITHNFAMGELAANEGEYIGGLVGQNATTNAMVVSANNVYDQTRTGQAICSTEFEDEGDAIYGEPLLGLCSG